MPILCKIFGDEEEALVDNKLEDALGINIDDDVDEVDDVIPRAEVVGGVVVFVVVINNGVDVIVIFIVAAEEDDDDDDSKEDEDDVAAADAAADAALPTRTGVAPIGTTVVFREVFAPLLEFFGVFVVVENFEVATAEEEEEEEGMEEWKEDDVKGDKETPAPVAASFCCCCCWFIFCTNIVVGPLIDILDCC